MNSITRLLRPSEVLYKLGLHQHHDMAKEVEAVAYECCCFVIAAVGH